MKKIKITHHISCYGGFTLLIGEKYIVTYEGYSNEKKCKAYLVETNIMKNRVKLPLVVYESECQEIPMPIRDAKN